MSFNLPTILEPAPLGSGSPQTPLGCWTKVKGQWGVSFAATSTGQSTLVVPRSLVPRKSRAHPYVSEFEEKGEQYARIAASRGAFVPVQLSAPNIRRLDRLAAIADDLAALKHCEKTYPPSEADDPCELARAALAEKVIAYESDYGQLAESVVMAAIGEWKDWRLIVAIKTLVDTDILDTRKGFPKDAQVPQFLKGNLNDRLGDAFRAVMSRFGTVDLNAIAIAAGAEDMPRDQLRETLEDLRLVIQLPDFTTRDSNLVELCPLRLKEVDSAENLAS